MSRLRLLSPTSLDRLRLLISVSTCWMFVSGPMSRLMPTDSNPHRQSDHQPSIIGADRSNGLSKPFVISEGWQLDAPNASTRLRQTARRAKTRFSSATAVSNGQFFHAIRQTAAAHTIGPLERDQQGSSALNLSTPLLGLPAPYTVHFRGYNRYCRFSIRLSL